MNENIDIAIIGAATPVGEALLEQLVTRHFPVKELIPLAFDTDDDDTDDYEDIDSNTTVPFGDKHLQIQNIAAFNFSNVALVFLCQVDDSYQPVVDRILDAGCRIIEIGSNLQNAPAVIADVNSDGDLLSQNQHIRSASGLGVVLTQLLKPVNDALGINALNYTALQSVSDKGKAGIDELAMQTTSLLNTRPIKAAVFKQQISFNVMPDDSEINTTGYTRRELDLIEELKYFLLDSRSSDSSIVGSMVHVPVFYGVSVDVHLELNTETDLHSIEKLLAQCSSLEIKPIDEIISPVSHAAEMDKIFINRIRLDPQDPKRLNFWCVTDTIKSGCAINGVQIAEILVKHHL